jgi:hypothetical protein
MRVEVILMIEMILNIVDGGWSGGIVDISATATGGHRIHHTLSNCRYSFLVCFPLFLVPLLLFLLEER